MIIGDLDGVSLHQPLIFNSGIQQKSLKEFSELAILQMGTMIYDLVVKLIEK